MKNLKKMTAAMLVVMVFFMLLSASFFVAAESVHECEGRGCPVCAMLQQCGQALRKISGAFSAPVFIMFCACFLKESIHAVSFHISYLTPVSQKIRLNN